MMERGFLPVCAEDLRRQGIDRLDFVYVTGDAYVDHPSFGHAIISRVLVSHGYTVGILPQPDWKDPESIAALGEPRLGFLVTAGNMDSMVNHYTVSRKHRSTDSYSPGGRMGLRPDRAVIVYANLIRSRYKNVPIIAGGIEASLRRMAHYDYWSDRLRRSVLMDCGADLISYGMGERSILEIADALAAGIPVGEITFVPGTCFKTKDPEKLYDCQVLPDFSKLQAEEQQPEKPAYAASFYQQYRNTDPIQGKRLAEPYGTVWVVQNPPSRPLSTQEMDAVYDLPYMRTWHPMYDAAGGIPAISEVRFSLVSNRGCFGGCNFCALTFHQGRIIQVRSHDSLLREAALLTKDPAFKGYIHDVGGPTADFRHPSCKKQLERGTCRHRQCLFPSPCPNLEADHEDYIALLRKLRAIPGVKKVFVRSGIRFDYVLADGSDAFLEELVQHHVSGQLKVAPEHVSDRVLQMLGKPEHAVFERFAARYRQANERYGKDQYLVPYFMSSHPGCRMEDAVQLAEYLRDTGHEPEQVQDFYPTPSTISTCMYYTGLDPRTMQAVYVPRDPNEKAMQRALMQYREARNADLVEQALIRAHRQDLIGYDKKCLIRPLPSKAKAQKGKQAGRSGQPHQDRADGRVRKNDRDASGRQRSLGASESQSRKEGLRGQNTRKKKRVIRNTHPRKANEYKAGGRSHEKTN